MNNYGMGIGLFTCKAILKHIGPCENFFITSELGKGTEISFFTYFDSQDMNVK
jgi:hypothetical protein